MTDKNPEIIKNIFNDIAGYYDKMNSIISFGLHYLIKKSAINLLCIKENSLILDLCCGTGDITKIVNAVSPSSKVIGVDNSEKMLIKAKMKNPDNLFVQADCTNLPFKNSEFDYASISFGLRNIQNRTSAISEIYRVLKSDGKFLHLDFGEHNIFSKIFDFSLTVIINIVPINKEHYKYLIESKKQYPRPTELINEFKNAGFSFIKKKNYLFGVITAIIMQKQ